VTTQKRTQRLERAGISNRKFWEDDLEMGVDSILRSAENDGFAEKWIGQRTGRQVTTLCRCLGIKADGSTQKKKEALLAGSDGLLPYLLVEQFAKFKSRVAIIDLSKGVLTKAALEVCRKDGEEDFDTQALMFALYERGAGNLQLVFHFDKIHKTGFARMLMKGQRRRPKRSLGDTLQQKELGKVLDDFDRRKRDRRKSELKAVVPHDGRFLVFIRRAERPDHILGSDGVVHGYRPEWIILDFEEGAKRVRISSISVSVPLEIANRIASEYYGAPCEYENEAETTYGKQIAVSLRKLASAKKEEVRMVELVVRNSPLDGSPKLKITDPDSNCIGDGIAHFEKAVGKLLDSVEEIESVKVSFRKKRVSLIFEALDGKEKYVVRYSDHRLNANERKLFESYMKDTHEIPVLSTEKRFKQ